MELPLGLQSEQFLCSFLLGCLLAACYDILRGLRRNARKLTHGLDALFALLCLVGNLLLALYVGRGEYRIFMLVGSLLGAWLWFLTLSRLFIRLSTQIWYILGMPLRVLWRIFEKILEKTKKFLKNIFSRRKKSVTIKGPRKRMGENGDEKTQIVAHHEVHTAGARRVRRAHRRARTAEHRGA